MHRDFKQVLKKLPLEERPRERLCKNGPEMLATFELIAVILGSGTKGKSVLHLAQELLAGFGSIDGLADASIEDLCQVKGMGLAKAIQLKAALTLGQRLNKKENDTLREIIQPVQAYHYIKEAFAGKKKEIFIVLLLDVRSQAIRWEMISVGTLTQTLVHPREVFYPAIRHRAASLILAHNHPSGDPSPSPQDYQITRQLIAAGRLIGIPVYDHLVIGGRNFFSMREEGFVF